MFAIVIKMLLSILIMIIKLIDKIGSKIPLLYIHAGIMLGFGGLLLISGVVFDGSLVVCGFGSVLIVLVFSLHPLFFIILFLRFGS